MYTILRCAIVGISTLIATGAITGCATVNSQRDYARVSQHVSDATGTSLVYQPEDDSLIKTIVDEKLQAGISTNESVDICLLNNPTLQAAFMDVGIARADAVQSGLFSNPFLGISARLPDGGGLVNLEASIAHNIAELWQIPIRKRTAERSLDAAILNLARSAANLAAKAKSTYYAVVSADEQLRIARDNLDITKNLLKLTLLRQQAGAVNELDVNLSRGLVLDTKITVEQVRLAAAEKRRELAILLGLTVDADTLVLTDPLPNVFADVTDMASLVVLAKVWRLDLQAAQHSVYVAEAKLESQYNLVWPTVELGLSMERSQRSRQGGRDVLADTARSSIAGGGLTAPEIQSRSQRRSGKGQEVILGPSLGIVLPIFDQNQAQIAKAQYALQQARKTLDAIERAVTQEVRSAVDRAMTASRLMHMYQDQSMPLAQDNLDLARQAFSAGRASFLNVLETQRFFLETRRGYVEASYGAARMIPKLERIIGLPCDRFTIEANKLKESNLQHTEESGS